MYLFTHHTGQIKQSFDLKKKIFYFTPFFPEEWWQWKKLEPDSTHHRIIFCEHN